MSAVLQAQLKSNGSICIPVFFNGLSILYMNEQYVSVVGSVAHFVERQFKRLVLLKLFLTTSQSRLVSLKSEDRNKVLNMSCPHPFEM